MRIAVTGGAGFIGSHLVHALRRDGHHVRVLDDLSSGRPDRLPDDVEILVGDVADPEAARAALEGCDAVCHLAARRSVSRSVDDPLPTDRSNAHGTLVVLDAASATGVRRVVNVSSSSVYGGADILPTPEDAPLVPRSPYAVSKLAAEHHCRVMAELRGLETVSLRYFNVYGPGQPGDGAYATVVPRFLQALLAGGPIVVHGDGHQRRDFCYVGDAVAATVAALDAPAAQCRGAALNVAGGEPRSILDVAASLEALLGRRAERVHLPARPGDVRNTHADLRAAASVLRWKPAVTLDQGLALTAAATGPEVRPSPPGGRPHAAAGP